MATELFAPMKFEHAEPGDLEHYISDDAWAMEQKLDGTRALLKITGKGVQYFTHGGRPLKHTAATQHFPGISEDMRELVKETTGTTYLDGEIINETGVLWLFDAPLMLRPEDMDEPVSATWMKLSERREALQRLFEVGQPLHDRPNVGLVWHATTPGGKERMLQLARQAEGVMVKHRGGTYVPGQRVFHSLKIKFVRTADVVVMERDVGGKNATLGVYGEDGHMVQIGACSMIGKPDAQPGEVVEVKYLYKRAALYQPRMMHIRDDKLPTECDMGQFESYEKGVIMMPVW